MLSSLVVALTVALVPFPPTPFPPPQKYKIKIDNDRLIVHFTHFFVALTVALHPLPPCPSRINKTPVTFPLLLLHHRTSYSPPPTYKNQYDTYKIGIDRPPREPGDNRRGMLPVRRVVDKLPVGGAAGDSGHVGLGPQPSWGVVSRRLRRPRLAHPLAGTNTPIIYRCGSVRFGSVRFESARFGWVLVRPGEALYTR